MTYADENLQEQETVNESTPSPNVKSDSSEDVAQHFICIKEVRPVSRAKALRLKTGDVIVGIESKTFLGSVEGRKRDLYMRVFVFPFSHSNASIDAVSVSPLPGHRGIKLKRGRPCQSQGKARQVLMTNIFVLPHPAPV